MIVTLTSLTHTTMVSASHALDIIGGSLGYCKAAITVTDYVTLGFSNGELYDLINRVDKIVDCDVTGLALAFNFVVKHKAKKDERRTEKMYGWH